MACAQIVCRFSEMNNSNGMQNSSRRRFFEISTIRRTLPISFALLD